MSDTYTVSTYLLDRLREVGVEHVFGVPGDYGFPFMDAVVAHGSVEWVAACNELNAGYAADGYARVRGMSAFSGACGVLDLGAAGAIAGAWSDFVPMVVISCYPSVDKMDRRTASHHSVRGDFYQFGNILTPIVAAKAMLTATDACAQIDVIIQESWSAKAPVLIQFPTNVQVLPAQPPSAPLTLREPESDRAELDRLLEAALPILQSAKRPAILADFPVPRYGLAGPIEELSAAAGIPFAATSFGTATGIDETHQGYLGLYDSRPTDVNQRIGSADALVRVCPTPNERSDGLADPLRTGPHLIDLQVASASINGTVYTPVAARDVLDRLRTQLPAGTLPARQPATPEPFTPQPGVAVTQDSVLRALQGFVRQDDTLLVDYGTCQNFARQNFAVRTRILEQASWEAIGWTTPATVGAQLADRGGRYIQILGDGAFQESGMEIATAIRNGLAPITLLLDNAAYEVENLTHEDPPAQQAYNDIHRWDYDRLPEVLGPEFTALGIRVTTEDELATALDAVAAAQQEGRYSLIHIALTPRNTSTGFLEFLGVSTRPDV